MIRSRLLELSLNQGLYADVHFLLDDGSCPAHRPLLMARCDVMDAMFAGDFRESSAKVASPIVGAGPLFLLMKLDALNNSFCPPFPTGADARR